MLSVVVGTVIFSFFNSRVVNFSVVVTGFLDELEGNFSVIITGLKSPTVVNVVKVDPIGLLEVDILETGCVDPIEFVEIDILLLSIQVDEGTILEGVLESTVLEEV